MALAVSGVTSIFNCDTDDMDGGTGTADGDVYIEGAGSLKLKVSNTLGSVAKYDQGGASGVDMSGQHFGIWVMTPATLDSDTNGGIRAYFEDAAGNWKECYISGADSYPGGWAYLVCSYDAAGDNTSGTYDSSTHRYCGVRFKTLSKSTSYNVWWDAFHYFNELTCTSGATDQVDMDDLVDWCKTNGNGLVVEYNGAYFVKTGIIWGSTGGTLHIDFKDTNKKIFFVANAYKSSTLYKWEVKGHTSTTSNYITGVSSGGKGINGIELLDGNASNKLTINFNDSNIDKLQIYGGAFTNPGQIDFPSLTGTNYECLSTTFNTHGIIYPRSFTIKFFNSISADNDAFSISSTTFNVSDGNIISPTNHGIEITVASTGYSFDAIIFSGTDGVSNYDVENTTAGVVTIAKTNLSNPQYADNSGGGSTNFTASYVFSVTGLELNTEVTIVTAGTTTVLHHTENAVTSDGDGKYKISYTHSGGASVDVLIHHKDYKPDISNIYSLTLPSVTSSAKVKMFDDENYENPT